MKKALKFYIIFTLFQLVIFACCPDPKTYFNKITNIKADNSKLQTTLKDSSSVNKKDFRIRLKIMNETISNVINRNLLINGAYALSCEDNYEGLKSDIISFKITCNKDILGTSAGESLDFSKMKVYKVGFIDDSKNLRITVNEMLSILNKGGYLLDFEWYFEFQEEIISNEFLNFKILIEQEDGSKFEVETGSIKIE
jgi:hypothetical protein